MQEPQLSPYESSAPALLDLLRKKLRDSSYVRRAFTLALRDERARSATAEIRNGQLRITVVGGSTGNVTIDLAGIETDTVGGLVRHFKTLCHYKISLNGEAPQDHPSTDLVIKGHGDLLGPGIDLNHRTWSDVELTDLLDQASRRHNMNYTVDLVPPDEHHFIVTLAAASACRELALDGVKLRGLSFDADTCLEMAASFENQYREDRARQDRAVPVAKIKDSNIEGGDVVQGTFFRRSLRTGYMRPLASAKSPEKPEIFVTGEEDIQDTQVRVHWRRVKDVDFYAMELWRDIQPDVRRAQLGDLTHSPVSPVSRPIYPTTAKLVYAPRWANSRYYHSALVQHGVASGQIVNNFVDGLPDRQEHYVGAPWDAPPPEPETTYYYVLYVFNINREVVGSNVLEVRTKRPRAVFSRIDDAANNPLDPRTGPIAGGTLCTIRGERFHEGMRVRLGDKQVSDLTIVSPTEATFRAPAVFNKSITALALDVIITSDTGMEDALLQTWRYTEV